MNLSNTLFNNVTNKLKLNTYLLEKERFYIRNLLNQVDYLKKLREKNYKNLSVDRFSKLTHKENNNQDLIIMYVINLNLFIIAIEKNTTNYWFTISFLRVEKKFQCSAASCK